MSICFYGNYCYCIFEVSVPVTSSPCFYIIHLLVYWCNLLVHYLGSGIDIVILKVFITHYNFNTSDTVVPLAFARCRYDTKRQIAITNVNSMNSPGMLFNRFIRFSLRHSFTRTSSCYTCHVRSKINYDHDLRRIKVSEIFLTFHKL